LSRTSPQDEKQRKMIQVVSGLLNRRRMWMAVAPTGSAGACFIRGRMMIRPYNAARSLPIHDRPHIGDVLLFVHILSNQAIAGRALAHAVFVGANHHSPFCPPHTDWSPHLVLVHPWLIHGFLCPIPRRPRPGHWKAVPLHSGVWPSRPRLGIGTHPRGQGCHRAMPNLDEVLSDGLKPMLTPCTG
jgi:hypothetical protein